MFVHKERSLLENLMSFTAEFEKHEGLGMQASADATAGIVQSLRLMQEQARRQEVSLREVVSEMVEESQLANIGLGEIRPIEREQTGSPWQVLEWAVTQMVDVSNAIARPNANLFVAASWLRYVAARVVPLADHVRSLEVLANSPPPPSGFGRSWIRAVLPGGRA